MLFKPTSLVSNKQLYRILIINIFCDKWEEPTHEFLNMFLPVGSLALKIFGCKLSLQLNNNNKKSCIQETLNLSTNEDSRTNIFSAGVNKGADTVTVTVTVKLLLS